MVYRVFHGQHCENTDDQRLTLPSIIPYFGFPICLADRSPFNAMSRAQTQTH